MSTTGLLAEASESRGLFPCQNLEFAAKIALVTLPKSLTYCEIQLCCAQIVLISVSLADETFFKAFAFSCLEP